MARVLSSPPFLSLVSPIQLDELAKLQKDNAFLRSYAARCELELKIYQMQYPEIAKRIANSRPEDLAVSAGIESGKAELAPWSTQVPFGLLVFVMLAFLLAMHTS